MTELAFAWWLVGMRFDAGKSKRSGTALPPSYHGCAAVGLCVFTGATTMAAVATMAATKATNVIFATFLQGSMS